MNPVVATYVPLISTLVATGCTVVLAVLTWKYVKLTAKLVEESQQQREPLVTVDFETPDFAELNFVLENHGASPARNVQIEVLQDTEWIHTGKDDTGLGGIHPIVHGVSLMTPGRKLKYRCGTVNWQSLPKGSVPVILQLSYENLSGKDFDETIHFDLQQLCHVLFDSFRDPADNVARAIKDSESRRHSDERFGGTVQRLIAPQKKRCNMCCEEIIADARVCRFCGASQEDED